MDKVKFVTELSKLRPASTFLTLAGYRNAASEVADYSIVFHMSYHNALVRSIATLEGLDLSSAEEVLARNELLNSFRSSLKNAKLFPIEERVDGYRHFKDKDGSYIKGVKLHMNTDTLHLYGLVAHKRVLMPGTYPLTNESPLAAAKRKLRHATSVGKFRQFKILPSQVDRIAVENISLLPPTE